MYLLKLYISKRYTRCTFSGIKSTLDGSMLSTRESSFISEIVRLKNPDWH